MFDKKKKENLKEQLDKIEDKLRLGRDSIDFSNVDLLEAVRDLIRIVKEDL